MPRSDKHREHWYATNSWDEDSTSYNISSSNIPQSEDGFPEPSPSQYKVERSKKQLDQPQSLEEESDDEEGDSKFFHFWENQISTVLV